MGDTDHPAPGPDSSEASSPAAGRDEAEEAEEALGPWKNGTAVILGIAVLFSLVPVLFAVQAAHQHKWAEFGTLVWIVVAVMAIGIVGMKFPSILEDRGPETLAEAAELSPKWWRNRAWQRFLFWAWLTCNLFLTAGAVALGVRQAWGLFAICLFVAVGCWMRFVYICVKRQLPPPGLPNIFPG
jgi:hypothetical protein